MKIRVVGMRKYYEIIIIIIMIMMKNFNRRSFHGHHGSETFSRTIFTANLMGIA